MLARNTPRFTEKSGVLHLPEVSGVTWKVDGKQAQPGPQDAIDPGKTIKVVAVVEEGRVPHGKTEYEFTREGKKE